MFPSNQWTKYRLKCWTTSWTSKILICIEFICEIECPICSMRSINWPIGNRGRKISAPHKIYTAYEWVVEHVQRKQKKKTLQVYVHLQMMINSLYAAAIHRKYNFYKCNYSSWLQCCTNLCRVSSVSVKWIVKIKFP